MKLKELTPEQAEMRMRLQRAISSYFEASHFWVPPVACLNLGDALVRWGGLNGTPWVRDAELWIESTRLVVGPLSLDGFQFFAVRHPSGKGIRIFAGCRYFASLKAARKHWRPRAGRVGLERRAIVNSLVLIAKARGWKL